MFVSTLARLVREPAQSVGSGGWQRTNGRMIEVGMLSRNWHFSAKLSFYHRN
jgi:hypothetical protein